MPDPKQKINLDLSGYKENGSNLNLDLSGYDEAQKKKSTSTTPPQKLVSGTKVGSSDGVKPIDKDFKMFPSNGELVKSATPKSVLPKINTDLQEAINKPENIAKRKEFVRQELFKSRENTKLKENEKQESKNDLLAKKQQEGVWNNAVAIGKDLISKASDFVFSMTDEQVTPEDLKIDKDPLSTEKKQAKDSLRDQGIMNPKQNEIDNLADEIYLDNTNTEKKQQKINSYLKGLDEQTKGILQVDAESRFKTLSKSKQDLTNRISLNEKYFNELQEDLSNPNVSEKDRLFAITERDKILKYLNKDHAEFSKNSEELGTAEDEFNAFKRNYNALDNTASRVQLSLANAGVSLYSGANYIANSLGAKEEYKQEGIQKAKTFLEERKNNFRPDNKDVTFDNFFQYSTDLLAGQSGTMAQIATGGVGGVIALGVEGAGDKYTEMYQDKKNGKNYSPNQMLITPFASGLFTAVLSEVPTIRTLKNSVNVWKSALKETAGKELISNAIKATSESIVKNIYRDTKKEVLTESIDNILQNAIKKDIQGDKSVGYFDNTLKTIADTALLTGMIGSSGALPHIAISAVKTFSEKAQAKSLDVNAKKISNLLNKLDDVNVNEATKKIIKDQIDLATKENSETINKTIDKMGKMPLNQIEIVYNNSKRLSELQQETINIKDDTSLDDKSKLILLNGLKEEYKNIEGTNLNIINGNTSPVESLPLKELESFKKQASNELIAKLNPDGTKNIKIDNEQITERANIIYLNQLKDAETKSTITNEAQPETEIQEPTITKQEQEVVESAQEGNTSANGNVRPTDNADLQQQEIEAIQPASNVGESKSDVEYAREQIDSSILNWDGNIFSPRIDLGMTWADIRKGQADLAKGKENTVPAKRLVEAINKAKEEGGYRYKFGTGSENSRATEFVTFEDMQKTKNEYNLTDAEQKEVIDNEAEYSKQYHEYFNSLNEQTQNEILDINENKSTEVSGNTPNGESKTNVSGKEASKGTINEGSERGDKEVEIQRLEQERDDEIINATKPVINESDYRVTGDDIKKAKIAPTREEMTSYKENYKALKNLKALINCL